MNLEGMIAVVTGSSRGIGKAIAMTLSKKGATVHLTARHRDALEQVAEEIRTLGGSVSVFPMDVGDPDEVKQTFQSILKETPRIDILVNNAGVRRDKLLVRLRKQDWQEVLDVNLSGAFYCLQQVIPAMSRARYGRIVNMASVVASTGNPGQANYAAAKAGILGLTRSVAREYASRGITVNAVAPGLVETDMTSGMGEKAHQEILQYIPMGRMGTPEDVAHTVTFLVSKEAGYITGQVIHVNGGMYI